MSARLATIICGSSCDRVIGTVWTGQPGTVMVVTDGRARRDFDGEPDVRYPRVRLESVYPIHELVQIGDRALPSHFGTRIVWEINLPMRCDRHGDRLVTGKSVLGAVQRFGPGRRPTHVRGQSLPETHIAR